MIYRLGLLTGCLAALTVVGGAMGLALHRSLKSNPQVFVYHDRTDEQGPLYDAFVKVGWERMDKSQQTSATDQGQPTERLTYDCFSYSSSTDSRYLPVGLALLREGWKADRDTTAKLKYYAAAIKVYQQGVKDTRP